MSVPKKIFREVIRTLREHPESWSWVSEGSDGYLKHYPTGLRLYTNEHGSILSEWFVGFFQEYSLNRALREYWAPSKKTREQELLDGFKETIQ